MEKTLVLLVVVTASAALHVGYVTPGISQGATLLGPALPPATGYIYRSDNNGPASLIQLGAVPFQQPSVFAPSVPLAQPIKLEALEAYDLQPAPLPYVVAESIDAEDAEEEANDDDDDDSDELSEELSDAGHQQLSEEIADAGHHHESVEGGGSDYQQEHHAAHGEKGSKGYKSNQHHTKGGAGNYGKAHQEAYHTEGGGEKSTHHNEADAHGQHFAAGNSYKGGDHGHKKHFSKGEEITGYHKVFNKDEFKKDHDFYDVADNSGHFKKHGYQKAGHGNKKGAHKAGGHHDSGHHKGEFGKAGSHAKAHHDEGEAGHSSDQGREAHYTHHEDFAKEGASQQDHQQGYDSEDEDAK